MSENRHFDTIALELIRKISSPDFEGVCGVAAHTLKIELI